MSRGARTLTRLAVAGAVVATLSGCGGADDSVATSTTAPLLQPARTEPPTTEPPTTEPATTEPATTEPAVTEADVAELERQLDEIDQILSDLDADLAKDVEG